LAIENFDYKGYMIKTATSFALGCVLFLQLHSQPSPYWLYLSLPACFLLKIKYLRFFSIFIFAGLWTLITTQLVINDHLAIELAGKELKISGTITNIPERQQQRLRFEFSPDESADYSLPSKLLLNWYKPIPDSLRSGERWQLIVKLKPIHGMMNPGSFDYESWLFQQKIGATGYVRTSSQNQRLYAAPFNSINALRQSLIEKIEFYLANSHNIGLIQGLTTGVRHNISPQQWQVLRNSGTNHLLAISGLHIGLAATIGFFLFRFVWSFRAKNLLYLTATESGAIGGFAFALFYASLAGFSIPTQRALLMVATVMICMIIRRPIQSNNILALSLLLVLVVDPLSVLSAGFWLSFSAVVLILYISQNRYPSPQWQWIKIHFLIAFGLSPLLLFFFADTSLIAPVANFVAIPFVSLLIVPLLLLASLFLWLYPPIGIALLSLADQLLDFIWPILETLASLPFSHWQSATISFYYLIPVIIGCALLLGPRGFTAKWIGLFGLLPLFLFSPDKPNKGEFWFTLLDVGQGLSAVVQTQHHTLVFDTGPKFSESFNTGTAIVKPFIQSQGIKHIDTLIVSHADNDHIGGAIPLIEEIKTTTILSSTPHLLPNATPCKDGQSWQWDSVDFSIIHPAITDNGSENNLSCVLKVSNTSGSILLTGDIEKEAEQLLVERYSTKLNATVLIAPHHGSKTSSSLTFINAVSPKLALFPVGYRNRYHFPNTEVIHRYERNDIQILNTAKNGAVSIKFGTKIMSNPISYRQSHHKIWTSNE